MLMTTGLSTELLRSSTCLESARRDGDCDHSTGFNMDFHMNRMMRFQSGDWHLCQAIDSYKNCLIRYSRERFCDLLSVNYLEKLWTIIYDNYCYGHISYHYPIPMPDNHWTRGDGGSLRCPVLLLVMALCVGVMLCVSSYIMI